MPQMNVCYQDSGRQTVGRNITLTFCPFAEAIFNLIDRSASWRMSRSGDVGICVVSSRYRAMPSENIEGCMCAADWRSILDL
jgi:hypothetical protein